MIRRTAVREEAVTSLHSTFANLLLSRHRRVAAVLALIPVLLLLLACGAGSTFVRGADGTPIALASMSDIPRWACPTATPLPPIEVEDGTKDNDLGTPEPKYRETDPYEREYGIGNRPPPRPTPYTKGAGFQSQTAFFIGQIVNWRSMDVRVDVAGSDTTGLDANERLYRIRLEWRNYGNPFPFTPMRQLVLTAISRSDGRLTGGEWRYSDRAAQLAGIDPSTLAQALTQGTTIQEIPIIAPDGNVGSIDIQLDQPGASSANGLRLHFTPGRAPECGDDGTWAAVYSSAPRQFSGVAAPPGADAIVATALKYVGVQYCWGGKGFSPCNGYGGEPTQVTPACASYPCFDCSGLTWFVYKENNLPIGQGTANQKNYTPVQVSDIRPGDLMLFSAINAQNSGARITHVGLYAGDLDGDGKGDMIHAANYPTGVVITKNVLGNPYYLSHLVVVTRPPRGGGL